MCSPEDSSPSFRPISSESIDFDFTTRVAPCAAAISITLAIVSGPSTARCTVAPTSRAVWVKRSTYAGRSTMTASFISARRCRDRSNSVSETLASRPERQVR